MNAITLSWEDWRAVVAVLRAKELPYMREHADHIERLLERHGPDEPLVTRSLTDDDSLRSYNGARLELGIPLPPMQR
jgi:hypothetical protein